MATVQLIVPVYNTAPYLEECFESLVKQTFTDWEAIVINDGSSDTLSPQKCDDWSKRDERLKVFHLPENRGISAVRNFGVNQATAPLIGFLDSDDSLAEQHLASLVGVLSQTEADMAMCGYLEYTERGKKLRTKQLLPSGTALEHPKLFIETFLNRQNNGHLWNKLYRRELFEEIAFPDRRYYEDYPIVLALAAAGKKLVHTGQSTYYYRQTPKSITHTTTPLHLYNFFEGLVDRFELLRSEKAPIDDYTATALSVWSYKNIYSEVLRMKRLLPSEERTQLLDKMVQQMRWLGIAPLERFFRLQMIALSLQKRYFERRFPE